MWNGNRRVFQFGIIWMTPKIQIEDLLLLWLSILPQAISIQTRKTNEGFVVFCNLPVSSQFKNNKKEYIQFKYCFQMQINTAIDGAQQLHRKGAQYNRRYKGFNKNIEQIIKVMQYLEVFRTFKNVWSFHLKF